jgi:hypothetical protein
MTKEQYNMSGRRAAIGLSLLCALVFSAISVSSAAAATEGTTAFTCSKEVTTKTFVGEHCLSGTGTKEYGHKAFTGATTIAGTNAKTETETTAAKAAMLNAKLAGVGVTIACTTVSSTGSEVNNLEGEKHDIKGSGIVISYSGCTVPEPASQHCSVANGGTITTNSLTSTSTNTSIVFSPPASEIFANILLTGCLTSGLNGVNFPAKGTVAATPNGATLETTEAASTSTLTVGGNPAGLAQTETVRRAGTGGNPLVTKGPNYLTD